MVSGSFPSNSHLSATFSILLRFGEYLGLVEATLAVTKKWLAIRAERYIFMSAKNIPSSQYYIIYSAPFGWPAPLYSPPKRCDQHQPKTCVGSVLGKPPRIAGTSTTICTRFISRAASLCTNLDGNLDVNLCPTLTAHSEPLPLSEVVHSNNPHLHNSFGMKPAFGPVFCHRFVSNYCVSPHDFCF